MCARIAVFYQVRKVSGYICVFRIAVFYQTRRVSGHICVLGLRVLPGQESEWSYMC